VILKRNPALGGLKNDPIRAERFVIDLAESLQRSDPTLMMSPLPVIDAIARLHGETAPLLQNAGFASLTEYVREVTRPDDRADSQPIFVAFDTSTKRCAQVYRCHHHQDKCPAYLKIRMYRSGMQLGDHQFAYDHDRW
jgi:hypothetical protein